jgi:glycosyltransferase involved in cell wall biosynthesis
MNTSLPLVSIVIPAYNAAPHLQQTLDCVFAQSCQSFEIIIVDDGSTDTTAAIAARARLRDSRVRLVSQPNLGVGAARNAGIRIARGKYIAPLDADDLWSPRKLERLIDRLAQAGPRAGLVYCWSRNIDQENRVISWGHPYQLEGRTGSALMLGNFVGSASVPIFRASTLAAVGPYLTREKQNGAQGCEDWDLHIRIAERFSLCCVPEYLVSYRQTGTSMSRDPRGMATSYETIVHRTQARNPELPSAFFMWSAGRFYTYLVNRCYGWSNYSGTLMCLAKVLSADPAAWLNSRNYRFGATALFHFATFGKLRRHRQNPPLSPTADPLFKMQPPEAGGARCVYECIQSRRLAVALQHRWSSKARVRLKRAFGY